MKLRHCPICGNKGVLRVEYHSGDPYDVAVCTCAAGQCFRSRGEAAIRLALLLPAEHGIGLLEDFDGDDAPATVAPSAAFTDAGKTAKRAKL